MRLCLFSPGKQDANVKSISKNQCIEDFYILINLLFVINYKYNQKLYNLLNFVFVFKYSMLTAQKGLLKILYYDLQV